MAAPLIAAPMAVAVLGLALFATNAAGVELVLDSVTATTGSGDVALRVGGRARFDFDPDSGVLQASGTWLAEYALPNQLTRFAHKVEDLQVSADNVAMKSYECVEGAFGAAFMNANICGNYRFGPNGIDDGGLGDDDVVGSPRALAGSSVSAFDWDGEALTVVLTAAPPDGGQLFNEYALKLYLVVKPDR
jgi:hypothetical protein